MPGSGKTFVAKHLIESLRKDGIKVGELALTLSQGGSLRRVAGKIWLVTGSLLVHRGIFRSVLTLVSAYKVLRMSSKVKLVFNWLYLCGLIRRESKHAEILVLDQGLAQALWSTLYYGEARPAELTACQFLQSLLKQMAIEALHVVNVVAPDDCIENRLARREHGKSPLDRDRQGAWNRAILVTGEAKLMIDKLSQSTPSILLTDISNSGNDLNIAELDRIRQLIDRKPCVVFVANRGYGLTSSRRNLIKRFLDSGWKVIIASADDDESRELQAMGACLEPVIFNRGGLKPLADLRCYLRLRAVYRRWRPNLIQHFHAKPVLFGALAARQVLGGQVKVVNTITGLGRAFTAGGLSAWLAGLGYKSAIPVSDVTIFQNRDDRALFLERNWVSQPAARLIASSGVDTKRFSIVERSGRDSRAPVIVMLGRLLRQKGIPEFAEVAARIRKRLPGARFLLAGEAESGHADAMTPEWLQQQTDIEFLGRLPDVVPVLLQADLFLFPSYYREGVPRALLEAAAMGLPVIGFDVPGVREAVRDGETGYLVEDRNVDALTTRVAELLDDASLRHNMGLAARNMIEESFDVRSIETQYVEVYRGLGMEVN